MTTKLLDLTAVNSASHWADLYVEDTPPARKPSVGDLFWGGVNPAHELAWDGDLPYIVRPR